MNKQVQQIRAEIKRLQGLCISDHPFSVAMREAYDSVLRFIDTMQEDQKLSNVERNGKNMEQEPATSVWHDASDVPEIGRKFVVSKKG